MIRSWSPFFSRRAIRSAKKTTRIICSRLLATGTPRCCIHARGMLRSEPISKRNWMSLDAMAGSIPLRQRVRERLPACPLYGRLPAFSSVLCRAFYLRAALFQFGCYLLPILLQFLCGALHLTAVEPAHTFVSARRLFNDGGDRRAVHILERSRALDHIPLHIYGPLRGYLTILFCILARIEIVARSGQSGGRKYPLR